MVRTSVIQLAACVCFFPYFGNICNLLLKMPGNIFICWHTIHDIPEQMRARAYPCFISMVEQACLYFSLMFLFSTAGFPPPSPTPIQYSPLTFHQVFKSVYPVHNEGEFSWPWTRNNDSGMNLKLALQSNSNMEYKICDDLISHLSSVPAKNFKRVIWSDYTSVLCVKDDDIISDKELLVLDLVCWCDLHKFWTISYSCFNEKLSPPYI